jgi:uncharacterized membrane protein
MVSACAAALLLRLFHLGHQSLWIDEVVTWQSAGGLHPVTLRHFLVNVHGPLHQFVLFVWMRLAGDSEFALRLPSALAGVALVPAFAGLARRLLGPRAGVPAAWIAALSPFLVWYGQEARNYSFAILFATLAAWAAVRWHQRAGRADGLLFVLAAWLGLLSNLNVALVLPVLLAYVALPHDGRKGRPWAALGAAAALVCLESPWLFEYAQRLAWQRLEPGREALPGEIPLRGATTFSWGAHPFTLYVFSVGYTLGPTLRELHVASPWRVGLAHWPVVAAAVALFGALAVRGLVALARRRATLALALGVVLVPAACVTYFALQNFKVFNARYLSAGLAGYYLVLLAGWLGLSRRARAVAAVLVLGLWGLSLANHYFVEAYGKEDTRSAAAWLAARIGPADKLIAAGSGGELSYYWRGRTPEYVHYWLGFAADSARLRERFVALAGTDSTAYVVVSRPFDLDPERRFERYLRRERGAEAAEFSGATVYRLAPAPDRTP